ncbi:hypothetical protein Pcinc_036753 [Petrolisthes cinctipes]|uniref:MOB kinase activator-like 2 n=1 Tax=Petrolisthes cinctipes TaxID=88211 RepID=A0AAE1EM92_PETCI|nr:hypothetical protein Pcinc_036753 [Petrolisthes cinctipes]
MLRYGRRKQTHSGGGNDDDVAIDFFQHINLVYGTVSEYCTMSGCPDMTGPTTRQYLWFDEKGKKTRVAAPQYVDYVMTFTQKTLNDENIFPTKFENDFPVSFESIVKKIHRLLFHVLAHLYHSHFRELLVLNLHAHLNCIFAHFILFNDRFHLIDDKETEILHDLVVALRLHPESEEAAAAAAAASGCSATAVAATGDNGSVSGEAAAPSTPLPAEGECGSCSSGPEQPPVSHPSEATSNSSSGAVDAAGAAGLPPGPDTRP